MAFFPRSIFSELRPSLRLLDEPLWHVRPRFTPSAQRVVRAQGAGPACDLHETDHAYHLELEAVGLKRGDLKVEFKGEDNRTLVIESVEGSSEAAETKVGEDMTTWLSERWGRESFSRTFSFPSAVDVGAVKAKMDNGLLTLNLPKSVPASTSRSINVE